MILADTHAHLYLEEFNDDRRSVIENAAEKGIKNIFLPNIDNSSITGMMSLCKEFPKICFPMMGIHPSSIKENYEEELQQIELWLTKEKFYGIGEIGIDLYWDKTFLKEQEIVFRQQLDWAVHLNIPAIIHMRKSFDEIYKIIKEYKNTGLYGIFHCYGGNTIQAKQLIELGFSLGIGGVVTYKNSGMATVVNDMDLSHIVLETDAPFLPPVPFRGKRNESAYIYNIAEKIAEIKNISIEEVAEVTTANALKIFQI
jgi:TatD DNase family protein